MDVAGCRPIFSIEALDAYTDTLNSPYTMAWTYRNAVRALPDPPAVGSVNDYPRVCLFRHAVELYLKSIFAEFGASCKSAKKRRKARHDLKSLLKQVHSIPGVQIDANAMSTIEWLHNDDIGAIKYRYCDEAQGVPAFDLKTLCDRTEKALDHLDGLWWKLYDHRDLSPEISKQS